MSEIDYGNKGGGLDPSKSSIALFPHDCLEVAENYPPGHFQLLLTSTPYPGQAGFNMSTFDYMNWWWERLRAWLPKMDQRAGVVVQNIQFKRTGDGWYDDRALSELLSVYRSAGLMMIDIYPWDKLNAPPSGNHDRHDRNEWEFCFALALHYGYKLNPYRKPYAEKTVGKAKPGHKMRQRDVWGSHAGGHSKLHSDGARQSNVLRISSSGDQNRPRVAGGVFPRELAERFILQFSDPWDHVVDPFMGSGTTIKMASKHRRHVVGCEIDKEAYDVAYKWVIDDVRT
jgi:DNA modification methylase